MPKATFAGFDILILAPPLFYTIVPVSLFVNFVHPIAPIIHLLKLHPGSSLPSQY